MKNTKTAFLKGIGFLGLTALVLGAFLVPFYQASAEVVPANVGLTASPGTICAGEYTELNWSSTDATSVTITPDIGSVDPYGSRKVYPTQTTTYTITGSNSTGGYSSGSITVNVSNTGSCTPTSTPTPTPNPTVNISANPSNVPFNGSSVITWSSNNAISCNATSGTNGWSGLKATSGSFHTGALSNTTTFGITCTNSAGASASDFTTVTVSGQTINNPTVFTQSATNISSNSATLNGFVTGGNSSVNAWFQWGTNPSNLFASTNQNFYGSGSTNFSAPIFNLSPNTIYYFRAVAQGQSGIIYGNILSFSTTGNIFNPPLPNPQLPSVNLTADSTNIAFNGSTVIRWNSANATSCVASGGSVGWAGTKSTGPASFFTGALSGSRTYVLTCTNIYGSATDSVTVTVRPQVIVPGTTPAPRPAASSLVIVTASVDRNQPILPTIDNTMPRPGDEINYTVTYKNIGNASITNLSLQIVLPAEVEYMFSNPSNPSIFGQTLIFNLGTLRANTEGQVTIRVRVRDDVDPGTILNFPATLSYIDNNGQPQSVSANVTAEVFRDGESQGFFLGANVFGADGFLPGTLFGWLLLIILILLLVLLAKYLFSQPHDRYLIAPAPQAPPYNPPQQNTIIH
ncbi:MAG: hypothetical protein WD991_01705 [Candidatus Paceibacterota bacterium]